MGGRSPALSVRYARDFLEGEQSVACFAKSLVHIREKGLLRIERSELYFRVDHHSPSQPPRRTMEDVEFGALDVDLEIVDIRALRHVIETVCLDRSLADHSHELLQAIERR